MEAPLLRFVYAANILLAGSVGWSSLFAPDQAQNSVFAGTASPDAALGVVGAFWCTVAILSAVGLFLPEQMAVLLVVQLVYKALWLLAFAMPAWRAGEAAVPSGVAVSFALWVVVLPFAIPWRTLFTPG
ncbi:MAG: hypothetical protein AAGI91_11770 [Bacteroidota bacterium]